MVDRIRVRLVSSNTGLPLVVAAIKTSMGKLREKGIDYYIEEYPKAKYERMLDWAVKASRDFPSVLEHAVYTVLIDGLSRACSHQLVRHRIASYTQESQRYSIALVLDSVPEKHVRKYSSYSNREKALLNALRDWVSEMLTEIDYALHTSTGEGLDEILSDITASVKAFAVIPPNMSGFRLAMYLRGLLVGFKVYTTLLLEGTSYEDARYALPQAVRTRLLVTANLRQWLHMIQLRTRRQAQWEIRHVMNLVKRELFKEVPVIGEMLESYRG